MTREQEILTPYVDKYGVCEGMMYTITNPIFNNVHTVICGDMKAKAGLLLNGTKVDLVCTDPPYLTTDLAFDKDSESVNNFWIPLLDYVKDDGYLIMTNDLRQLVYCSEYWHLRFQGVWLKQSGSMKTHATKKPMRQMELYGVFAHPKHKIKNLVWNDLTYDGNPYYKTQKKASDYLRDGVNQVDRANTSAWTKDGFTSENYGTRQYTDVLKFPNKTGMKHSERTLHPTQKPIDLFKVFIGWTTNERDFVLEPFMGSGTTLLACDRLNRNCYAIEKNPLYVGMALDRFEREGLIVKKEGILFPRND